MIESYFYSIELPVTIPRFMFDYEIDYNGIASDKGITDQESLAKTIDSFTLPFNQTKMKHDMFFLALACYDEFGQWKVKYPDADYASIIISNQH